MQKQSEKLSRTELLEFFKNKFGQAPFLNKIYLEKYYIYLNQEKKYGGLSTESQKYLEKLINKYKKSNTFDLKNIQKSKKILENGTKLIREFKGEKYEVSVLDNGYEYNGKIYRSLSAIANLITGTRWNGKVFFGVKKLCQKD